MKKKYLSLIACIGFLISGLSGISPALAAETNIVGSTFENGYSEYELLRSYEELSDDQLAELGLSSEEITDFRSMTLEERVLERAQLPRDVLSRLGYNNDQIELLKGYDGSEITDESAMVQVFSEFSYNADISNTADGNGVEVTYDWSWSSKPFFCRQDVIAFTWEMANPASNKIGTKVKEKEAEVSYIAAYTGLGNPESYTEDLNIDTSTSNQAIVNIPMWVIKVYMQNNVGYWCKEGSISLTIEKTVSSSSYDALQLLAKYGHAVIVGDFSVDITSLSISFSPAAVINTHGVYRVNINKYGNKTYPSA